MAEQQHTPGPWTLSTRDQDEHGITYRYASFKERPFFLSSGLNGLPDGHPEQESFLADARLIAAAPDHALLLRTVLRGLARWEPFNTPHGEVCVGGLRYLTELDEFGCPALNDSMRYALAKAEGKVSA